MTDTQGPKRFREKLARVLCQVPFSFGVATPPNTSACAELGNRPARAIAEFVQHYHHERNHQGLENALIVTAEVMESTGKVVRRDRLGGVLGFYYRKAA